MQWRWGKRRWPFATLRLRACMNKSCQHIQSSRRRRMPQTKCLAATMRFVNNSSSNQKAASQREWRRRVATRPLVWSLSLSIKSQSACTVQALPEQDTKRNDPAGLLLQHEKVWSLHSPNVLQVLFVAAGSWFSKLWICVCVCLCFHSVSLPQINIHKMIDSYNFDCKLITTN